MVSPASLPQCARAAPISSAIAPECLRVPAAPGTYTRLFGKPAGRRSDDQQNVAYRRETPTWYTVQWDPIMSRKGTESPFFTTLAGTRILIWSRPATEPDTPPA